MRRSLELWFDFGSTYSYPAALRIEALAGASGVDVSWRPFLLGPIFRLQGWNDSPFNLNPRRGAYMWRDVARVCADLDIPFRKPTVFPRNGILAARVATRFEGEGWVPEFVRTVYRANFAEDREISDREVIASCLAACGVDPEPALAAAVTDEAKGKLRERTDEAERRGVFGAPTFFAGDEMFWGNDRLERALAWVSRPSGS